MLISLYGCSTKAIKTTPTADFNYIVEGGVDWGVIQAFTASSKTHIQFLDIDQVNPMFISPRGREIKFKVLGMYAILDNAPAHFFVVSSFGRAYIIQKELRDAIDRYEEKTLLAKSIEKIKTEPLITIKRKSKSIGQTLNNSTKEKEELSAIQKVLGLEKNQIEALQKINPNGKYFLADPSANKRATIRAYFPDYSTYFSMNESDKEIILAAASQAKKIHVRGFTDSFVSTKKATQLAKFRAINSSRFFKSNGIKNINIRSFYNSSNDFLVQNTKKWKKYNRRSEITFYF